MSSLYTQYQEGEIESLLSDIQTLHDCQDIIESKHREAMTAVKAKFYELTSFKPSFTSLELVFKDRLEQAMADTLDELILDLKALSVDVISRDCEI
jgi:hypothetical protein